MWFENIRVTKDRRSREEEAASRPCENRMWAAVEERLPAGLRRREGECDYLETIYRLLMQVRNVSVSDRNDFVIYIIHYINDLQHVASNASQLHN